MIQPICAELGYKFEKAEAAHNDLAKRIRRAVRRGIGIEEIADALRVDVECVAALADPQKTLASQAALAMKPVMGDG